jgi:hypothetical protein
MLRYAVIFCSIILPFALYYLVLLITDKINRKFPLITLSLISLILLICSLIYFRLNTPQATGTYIPPQFENNKVIPSKVK